jgi:hypothetical protein
MLRIRLALILLPALVSIPSRSQEGSESLRAKELYYGEGVKTDPQGTTRKKASGAQPRPKAQNHKGGDAKQPPPHRDDSGSQGTEVVAVAAAVREPVRHLGMRYNVLLHHTGGDDELVDADRVFRTGECLALEVESNAAGYLYVFTRGGSGQTWTPLLPSALAPEESNRIEARSARRVPMTKTSCFDVNDPPGVEQLFVVVSRSPDELYALVETMRRSGAEGLKTLPETDAAQPQVVAAIDKQVEDMRGDLKTRDLGWHKDKKPEGGQPANAVYVVNMSEKPGPRVVADIKVQHQ